MKESSLGRTESPPVSGWFGNGLLFTRRDGPRDCGFLQKKKSVILLGLTIRQIELPGFRKRKQTQKRKTQARGNKKLPPPGAA